MQFSDHQPMLFSHVVTSCTTLLRATSATAAVSPPYSAHGKKGFAVVCVLVPQQGSKL